MRDFLSLHIVPEARPVPEPIRPFNDGTYMAESNMTVADLVDGFYLPWVKEQRKPSTYT